MLLPRRPPTLVRIAGTLLAGMVAACGSTAPTGSPSAPPTAAALASPSAGATTQASLGRADGWRADLAALVSGMDAIHPNLTHGTPRAELDAAAAALAATVDTASDDELMVGVLRTVALVSRAGCDAHTGAYPWGSGSYPVDSLPLRLWLFSNEEGTGDEVVVVDALPPYAARIGSRVDTIEGHPISDVLAAIDPLVPRDNAQTVRLLTPRFMLIPQVLRGLRLADAGPVSIGLSTSVGPSTTEDVVPIPMADYNAWAGPYGLHLPANPSVRYLSRIDEALWWDSVEDDTLYVQYNRVDPPAPGLLGRLQVALHGADVARVVLDVRHNFGGELSLVDPVRALFEDPAVDQPDRLHVLIGRNTFSAGTILVARLRESTGAQLLGEATGGCPTIWSDASDLLLPHAGIVVSVAGAVAVGTDPADPRRAIDPDVQAAASREEWAAGVDPALRMLVGVGP